jgi:hypothetical protein
MAEYTGARTAAARMIFDKTQSAINGRLPFLRADLVAFSTCPSFDVMRLLRKERSCSAPHQVDQNQQDDRNADSDPGLDAADNVDKLTNQVDNQHQHRKPIAPP